MIPKASLFSLSLFILTNTLIPVQAFTYANWCEATACHPVIAVGGGASSAINVGESHDFPIHNHLTEEFYLYSANDHQKYADFWDIFAGMQWNVSPRFQAQVGLDYNQAAHFVVEGTFLQGADAISADTYAYQYDVLTRQLLLEGKLLYTLSDYFHPYLLAGLGVSSNKAAHYETDVSPFLTFTRMYADNRTTSFGYALGAGVDVDVFPQIRIGVGYRFAGLGKVSLGDAIIDTTFVGGTLSQSNLSSNQFLAQLTWMIR